MAKKGVKTHIFFSFSKKKKKQNNFLFSLHERARGPVTIKEEASGNTNEGAIKKPRSDLHLSPTLDLFLLFSLSLSFVALSIVRPGGIFYSYFQSIGRGETAHVRAKGKAGCPKRARGWWAHKGGWARERADTRTNTLKIVKETTRPFFILFHENTKSPLFLIFS